MKRDGENIERVWHGAAAVGALLRAFIRSTGNFTVETSIGTEGDRPGQVLVLIEIGDTRAVFEPDHLLAVGRSIVESIPMAERLGAGQRDVDELRSFAAILIKNGEDAKSISPHGLH